MVHFFSEEVHQKWDKHCSAPGTEPLGRTLEVVTDFEPAAAEAFEAKNKAALLEADLSESESEDEVVGNDEEGQVKEAPGPKWGIHALPLDHTPLAPYLEKGQNITTFEREGACVVCHQDLDHEKGLYAICSSGDCEGVGHLDCWGRHLLHQRGEEDEDSTVILPMQGRCPKCNGAVRWSDMMRELTLRTRGQKEIDKVLRKSKRAAGVTKAKSKTSTKSTAKGKRRNPKATAIV